MKNDSSESPVRGRPREFDPDAVVERAMNVFWSRGYQGTSLPDLLEATGLSRGSLYAAFGDKHGCFLRALDRYIEDALARFDQELDPGRGALDGLRVCLAGYIERTTGQAGRRGCLVVATAMELTSRDVEAEKRIRGFFHAVETKFIDALTRARAEGDVKADIEPAAAARVLLSVVEGIRVIAKTGVDRAAWQASVDALLDGFAN